MSFTIEDVRAEIKKMDPSLDLESRDGMAAQFLMSAVVVGTGIRKIAPFMGVSETQLRVFRDRARRYNIFLYNGKINAKWSDPEEGAVSFWLDVMTVTGEARRKSIKGVQSQEGAKHEN